MGTWGGTLLGQALPSGDVRGAVEAMELLAEATDLLGPDDQRWLMYAGTLGSAHLSLTGLPGLPDAERPAHLEQGISWLVHAHRLADGPANPLWGGLGTMLAWAYRLRGDWLHDPAAARRNRDEARRVGLRALTGVTWSVLLQSGTPHAAEAGREAADHALDVARWCLADGAYEDAVRALDAGRGLLLHAATVAATVPETLTALGRADLAEEWRAAGPVPPDPAGGMGTATGASGMAVGYGTGDAWTDGDGTAWTGGDGSARAPGDGSAWTGGHGSMRTRGHGSVRAPGDESTRASGDGSAWTGGDGSVRAGDGSMWVAPGGGHGPRPVQCAAPPGAGRARRLAAPTAAAGDARARRDRRGAARHGRPRVGLPGPGRRRCPGQRAGGVRGRLGAGAGASRAHGGRGAASGVPGHGRTGRSGHR
ncbi:hypothetical protein AB0L35_21095 [Streptomyces sp. NPDC052309]|uniref:hypothetical protein n=1 Tax=Streptomyces sp. NPDC052309 TaxID=3155421 RepID=UPI00342917FE